MNWNPNDPILNSPHAPHETRATLRMHRNGWPGPDIAKVLKIKGTKLMKSLDYGKDYRYAHDEPGGFAAGESYWPEGMVPPAFYEPVERGLEIRIAEKLRALREQNHQKD